MECIMRTRRWVLSVVIAAAAVLPGVVLRSQAVAPAASAAFDKLRSLAGEWEGTYGESSPARVNYRVVSGGSALVETLQEGSEPEMVTVYHLDGDKLMLTHYCSAGNQPRMVAVPLSGGNELTFVFKDITNLSGRSEGHMRGLKTTFVDEEHFAQEWTWHENGKDQRGALFRFQRVR